MGLDPVLLFDHRKPGGVYGDDAEGAHEVEMCRNLGKHLAEARNRPQRAAGRARAIV